MVNFKKKGKGREIKNQKKRMKEIIEKFYPSNYRERALQIIDNIIKEDIEEREKDNGK